MRHYRPNSILRPVGIWLILAATACAQTVINWTPTTLVPDNNPVGIADTRTVEFNSAAVITGLQVNLIMSGGWNGDLYASLVHDSGFTVLLNRVGNTSGNPGGSGSSGMNVTFSDFAATDIHTGIANSGSITGTWQPDARIADPLSVTNLSTRSAYLSSFNEAPVQGNWTLFLADNGAADTSTLTGWGLTISSEIRPFAIWDSNGNTSGIGGDGTWSSSSSTWATSVVGTSTAAQSTTAQLVFQGTGGNVNVSGTVSPANGLRFATNGYTVSGGTVQMSGATSAINSVEVGTGVTAEISSTISGSNGISKTGDGTLNLTGANTYTGTTEVTGGTLQVGNGGTTGDLGSTSGVVNNAALTFNRSNALTISPVISGTGSVTQAGTGTTTLSSDNTYTGTTTVTGGVLQLNSANALPGGIAATGGTSALTLNGGVIGLGTGDFTRSLGTGASQVQFTGSGGFAAYGADRSVNLGGAGATVTWGSGNFVPNNSSLILGAADSGHKITFENAIDFGGEIRTIQVIKGTATGAGVYDAKLAGALSNGSYTQTGDGRLEVTGAISGTTFDQNATNGTLALTSTLTTTGAFTQSGAGSTTTVSGTGSINAGSFTQNGAGSATTVTGTGSIVSQGAANLNAGTVTLSAAAANTAFQAPTINISGATVNLGASEQFSNDAAVVLASGSLGFIGTGNTETVTSFTNLAGTFITGANTLIGTGNTITWSGGTNTISNGGNVQDAHFVITGGTNTVEGGATGGVLQVLTGGAGLQMSNGSTLTLNSDNNVAGKLLLQGNLTKTGSSDVTIASGGALTNKGNIDLSSGNRTFNVSDGYLLVSASITNGALTKDGAGTMTLQASNDYFGSTTVNGGTLELGTDGALANTTNVTVNSGGTVLFSGTNNDKVNNSATVTLAGGTIRMDNTASRNESVGALTLSSTSIIDFGSFAGGNTLTFANSSGFAWTGSASLNIWNWSAGLDQLFFGSGGLTDTQLGQISFFSGSGTGFVGTGSMGGGGAISAVPEPSSVLMGLSLLSLIGYRERRLFLRCREARSAKV